ncbi:MAG: anthranilate phosphoribosyltransferase [Chthoniobacterales bacterium]|jgi:anthranilate phosphoribosyltransferase
MDDRLQQIQAGKLFGDREIVDIAGELLSGAISDEKKADFLQAWHHRGETPDEVRALADTFLQRSEPFVVPGGIDGFIDVCGTGGDKLGLFNISTAVMFVTAGAGVRVVKHGNRGMTSQSGGADVLEALGVAGDLPMEKLVGMLEEGGATFLFAPRFHPSFKAVVAARKILAGRGNASVFNMLGPLLNPASPRFQLAGVFSEALLPLYASVLPALGRECSWVVHGRVAGGKVMDEISTLGVTRCTESTRGGTRSFELSPDSMAVPAAKVEDLRGGNAVENAHRITRILAGEERGPTREIVVVNAAAALQIAGLSGGWPESIQRAQEAIDSGAARSVLTKMQRIAQA